MQFNSPEYAIFLLVVFFIFWFLLAKHVKLQNVFLLAVNYIFYALWNWKFLFLIVFISWTNYYFALRIGEKGQDDNEKKRRILLIISIIINLSLLGVFKYFNFFSFAAIGLLNAVGLKSDPILLNIILPIGISFYTFQAMSYIIDVYRTKIEPTKDFVAFFAYISFFPLVLAGPIERAGNLLKQFFQEKNFNYYQAADGLRQIFWGLFKKLVIADNCAFYANEIFNKYEHQPAAVLAMGVIYFAFQIYCDFSGYSDIAIGSAKLLGFNLMINFKTPYLSRNIAEFWRRWHISLSSWLRDYLFIPLNIKLRYLYRWGAVISILTTFLICGLWHGANWTFIAWGGLHGIYLIPSLFRKQNTADSKIAAEGKLLPGLREILQIGITFILVCFSWIFFRAETIAEALNYIKNMFSNKFLPESFYFFPRYLIFLLILFQLSEWLLFRYDDFLDRFAKLKSFTRRLIYAVTLVLIFLFLRNEASSFIYFQF